jgi:hypothetical protein
MKKIEYLILDYKRHEEAEILLNSIRKHSNFEYTISYLDNGSNEDYPHKLAEKYNIENLISNKINIGGGAGAIQLFAQTRADYCFFIQVDHQLVFDINKEIINFMINKIENENFAYIDLAGNQGGGQYSERAQFINPYFYNSIPKTAGGPGPWTSIPHTESCIQDYINNNNLKFITINGHNNIPFFLDKGKYSLRGNPDGSIWKHRTDDKRVWLIQGPVKEKYEYPPFSEKQWQEIILTQKCEQIIPEDWKNNIFKCWD